MENKIIKCIDCGQEFVWTVGEQEFYQSKALQAPTRCPVCRAIFKAAREDQFRGKVKNEV
jgi:DNA-directed RNA polymerase subunit RPC12/RpoP